MFENFAANNSEAVRAKIAELRNIVLEDPQYKAFVENGGSFETLYTYTQGNKDLHRMLIKMNLALDSWREDNLFADFLMRTNVHEGICYLNELNGYQLGKGYNFLHIDADKPEVTEKTEGASMAEKVYAFMEERNYRDIQTDPNALMLIHLAHLSEKMMDKMAEIVRLSELETAEKSMDVPQNDENQTAFFQKLTDVDDLDCILDEEKMEKKIEGVQAKIQKNREIIRKFNDGDPETKKEVLEAARAERPEVDEKLKNASLEIEKKYAKKKAQALEDDVAKYKRDLIRDNEDNKFINEEIQSENAEKRELNANLDKQIRELQLSREEKLKSFREKETKAEELRKQREEDFNKAVEDYYAKKETVPERVEKLEHEFRTLVEFSQASGYISNIGIIPPQSHFDELDTLQKKYDSLDYVRDLMFHLSGNDRNAKDALEMLSPSAVKTVKDLRKKLNTASQEEENANDKLLQETDIKKQPALLEKAKEATIKRTTIQSQFEPWKNAADLQDAMADLWKKNPDLKKEYKSLSKKSGKTTYEVLKEMGENYMGKMNELKGTQKQYYDSLRMSEQLAYTMKEKHMRPLEELGTVSDELKKAQEELKAIKRPDKNEYDKETKALCSEIYNKKIEEKYVAEINTSTDEAIRKLQDQRMEIEEMRPVLDDKTIEDMVAAKKQKLDAELTHVYHIYALSETADFTNAEGNKLMNSYVHGLAFENDLLRNVPGALEYKKETAEKNYQKTKDAYIKQQAVKEKWEQVKTKESPFADMLEKELASLSGSMLKGKKEGHRDTEEFNKMKEALESAHEYVKQNKAKLTALDENAVKEFKELLTDMSAKSATYYDLKQKGIHWRPSNMRFVRLNMSKRLQSTAADMSARIDEMKEIKKKEASIQSKADTFHVEDPGENYKEYTIHQAPKETVAKLNEKLTAEKASKGAKVNQKQNGKDMGLGGKK